MRDLQQNPDAVHRFERAGLGKAPFRVVGFYRSVYQAVPGDPSCPLKPGTSCDYCAQGIMYVCQIEGADGRRFKVGCDCVAKTGDAGLMKLAAKEERRRNRETRHAREAEKVAELRALLADEAVRARLAEIIVEDPWRKRRLLDTADWHLKNAGNAGKIRMLKQVRQVLAHHPSE
jgi:hypothetical protein